MTSFIYEKITQNLVDKLEALEEGDRWHAPWDNGGAAGGLPTNIASGKAYRGVNVLQLWMSGYDSSLWGTYKQWKAKGAQVEKGEHGTPIVFYKPLEKVKADGTKDKFLMARGYTVFNAEQTDYVPEVQEPAVVKNSVEANAAAEVYIKALGAKLSHGGNRAFYQPRTDSIKLPPRDTFEDAAGYYSTSFHEHGHWTGHKSRCDRKEGMRGRFGDEAYAMEELVAELTAAFLCHKLNVTKTPRDDHAKYLKSWLKKLKDDSKAIFTASSKAQQAVDHMDSLQAEAQQEKAA